MSGSTLLATLWGLAGVVALAMIGYGIRQRLRLPAMVGILVFVIVLTPVLYFIVYDHLMSLRYKAGLIMKLPPDAKVLEVQQIGDGGGVVFQVPGKPSSEEMALIWQMNSPDIPPKKAGPYAWNGASPPDNTWSLAYDPASQKYAYVQQ